MQNLTRDDINQLTLLERLALIGDLWDSIPDAELPLPSSQSQELDRRVASFEQDRTNAISWDKLKADLTLGAP